MWYVDNYNSCCNSVIPLPRGYHRYEFECMKAEKMKGKSKLTILQLFNGETTATATNRSRLKFKSSIEYISATNN